MLLIIPKVQFSPEQGDKNKFGIHRMMYIILWDTKGKPPCLVQS